MSEEYYFMKVIGKESRIKEFEEIMEYRHPNYFYFNKNGLDHKGELEKLENDRFSMSFSGYAKWSTSVAFLKGGGFNTSDMSEFIYNNPLVVRDGTLTRNSYLNLIFGLFEMKVFYNELRKLEDIKEINKISIIIEELIDNYVGKEGLPTEEEEINYRSQNSKEGFLEFVGDEDVFSLYSDEEINEIRERIKAENELKLKWLDIVEARIKEVEEMEDSEVKVPYSKRFGPSEETKKIQYMYNGWSLDPLDTKDDPFSFFDSEPSEEKLLNKEKLLNELNIEIRSIKSVQVDLLEVSERLGLTIEIYSSNDELFISEELEIKEGEIIERKFIPSNREEIEDYYCECKSENKDEREDGVEKVESTLEDQKNFLSYYE